MFAYFLLLGGSQAWLKSWEALSRDNSVNEDWTYAVACVLLWYLGITSANSGDNAVWGIKQRLVKYKDCIFILVLALGPPNACFNSHVLPHKVRGTIVRSEAWRYLSQIRLQTEVWESGQCFYVKHFRISGKKITIAQALSEEKLCVICLPHGESEGCKGQGSHLLFKSVEKREAQIIFPKLFILQIPRVT